MPSILFLTAYPVGDASCRYRIHQFIPHLEAAGYRCTVSSFATEQLFRNLQGKGRLVQKAWETISCGRRRLVGLRSLSGFEFVVIHREAFPFFQPVVEHWVIRRHPNVIFSFDDAIYAGHEDTSRLSHPILYKLKHRSGYDEVIRNSMHVIAGNHILREYAMHLNSRVDVIPTVVDTRQYHMTVRRQDDYGPVTIGWIGSRSTAPYLSIVEPALRRIAKIYEGKVRFRFVGCLDYMLGVAGETSSPFILERELEDLQSFDIGLMPLPDSEWTRGKCAFKAIQYMATGVVTVASPVGVTTDLIQHNVDGLLASSSDDWFVALERLVLDGVLRQRLAIAARQVIEQSYSLDKWGPRMVALFDRLRPVNANAELYGIAA